MAKDKAIQSTEAAKNQKPRYEQWIKEVTRETIEMSEKEKRVIVLLSIEVINIMESDVTALFFGNLKHARHFIFDYLSERSCSLLWFIKFNHYIYYENNILH